MSKQTPREAQAHRIERFLTEPTRAGLLADEPGVGKTLVAVELALAFERTLTIGIKDTYSQFADLMTSQSGGTATLRRIDASKPGKAALADMLAGEPGHYFSGSQFLTAQDWTYLPAFNLDGTPMWKIIKKTGELELRENPGIGPRLLPVRVSERKQLRTFAKMKPLDLIVFDEVHVIQNRKAIGGRTLRTLRSEHKLGMSGTPYGNKFPGIWAVCRWLWPDIIDASYHRWVAQWCVTETLYLGKGKTTEEVTGERTPGAFVATLPLYIRAEAERVPPAMVVEVDLSPIQRRQYEDLERDLMVWLGEHPLVVEIPAVLRQRLRTATLGEMAANMDGEIFFDFDCRSSKLQALGGILNYWGNQPVIIGTDSKRFARVTAERMRAAGERVALWTGDVSSKGRDEIKRQFLAGEIQYIVATIQSMSTGLDGFQKVCNKAVLLSELDGNEAINRQWIGRVFRPGRTEANGGFQWVKILARDTKDMGVHSANMRRALANQSTLRRAA